MNGGGQRRRNKRGWRRPRTAPAAETTRGISIRVVPAAIQRAAVEHFGEITSCSGRRMNARRGTLFQDYPKDGALSGRLSGLIDLMKTTSMRWLGEECWEPSATPRVVLHLLSTESCG